ncbi:MAG: inverse autotransporter beta domain-containing protein, partial [Halanaerobium sp.]
MQKRLSLIIVLSILITLFLSASITAEELYRQPRLNIEGITGDDFIGQAGVLYPFRNTEDSLWFTDFRYRMSEDDVDEWNLGLGYRKKIDTAENHIAGIYAFKDRREEYDHYWDMWTLGGEILTDQWDFRLNGYITDDDKVLAGNTGGLEVNSDQILVYDPGNDIYYKSMNGLDIEIGKRFTETDTIFKNVGVYAKLFRFFESDTP